MNSPNSVVVPSPTPDLALAPLRAPQVYEQIADRLRRDIAAGRLVAGQRLPSERELATRLEVGRSSVREAIGALQVDGILHTRPGSGSVVAADAVVRVRATDAPRTARDASPLALLDAREAIEPSVAAMAALHGRRSDELERLLDEMDAVADPTDPDQVASWSWADRSFHRQIAGMAANSIVDGMAAELARIMDQPLWRRLRDDSVAELAHLRVHAAEHRMIYEAVCDRDPESAARLARDHLRRVRRYMALTDPPTRGTT